MNTKNARPTERLLELEEIVLLLLMVDHLYYQGAPRIALARNTSLPVSVSRLAHPLAHSQFYWSCDLNYFLLPTSRLALYTPICKIPRPWDGCTADEGITPQLRLWLHSQSGISSTEPVYRIHLGDSTSSDVEESSRDESKESEEGVGKDGEGDGKEEEDETTVLMSSSVPLAGTGNPLYALKNGYEAGEESAWIEEIGDEGQDAGSQPCLSGTGTICEHPVQPYVQTTLSFYLMLMMPPLPDPQTIHKNWLSRSQQTQHSTVSSQTHSPPSPHSKPARAHTSQTK